MKRPPNPELKKTTDPGVDKITDKKKSKPQDPWPQKAL